MAADVSVDALRALLRTPSVPMSFGILQQICALVNASDEHPETIEMVLRALDRHDEFGALAPILDSLVRRVGLFPYAKPSLLSGRELLAYELHRPLGLDDEDVVFHRIQAQVYRYLLAGENVILSAPTSFGKSKIIDAMIANDKFANIAIIVPTLALIDETRRRLSKFGRYKVVTHVSQQPASRNLFVLTAERMNAYTALPHIDFFVIDEFYKLGLYADRDRMVALNDAFYRLRRNGAQFYLLGPNIERLPAGATGELRARWVRTDFHTVVCEEIRVPGHGNDIGRLVSLCRDLDEPTIIYCASPASVNSVANALVEAAVGVPSQTLGPAAHWVSSNFHPDWVFAKALLQGIGIHHGRLPRSLAQFVVRQFNNGQLRFLVCTSTLIEGVNTKAKNVVIFDNKIAQNDFDFFTFNNIKGRAGRMFQHFVGCVYLFAERPREDLPVVDLPLITQDERTPTSLLVQMEPEDLKPQAAIRVEPILEQSTLPMEVIRASSGIDPQSQIDLALALLKMPPHEFRAVLWTGMPSYDQLVISCRLVWEHFVPQDRHIHVRSASQLATKLTQLQRTPAVPARIVAELNQGKYSAKSPDEAVERVLSFDRNWASFEMPRYLSCLMRVVNHVASVRGGRPANYTFYIARLESLFNAPVLGALDEYGIPPTIGEKILSLLGTDSDLDTALASLRRLDLDKLRLMPFEADILQSAIDGI